MKNIFLVIPTICQGGGAARVFINLINNLNMSKYRITLVVNFLERSKKPRLPNCINIIELGYKKSRFSIFALCKKIHQEKPDIVFSTMGHFNLLIGLFKFFLPKKTVFIARETNTVSVKNKYQPYPKLFDFMYKVFYKKFNMIIAQAEYMKDDLIKNFGIPKDKIMVINNPIDTSDIDRSLTKDDSNKEYGLLNLISLGSLSYQKGYDLLIESLSMLDVPFRLEIYGTGSSNELNKLHLLVKRFELTNKVIFKGYTSNPYAKLVNSDMLLLSSRYEGFPNVVLEANYCGLPVIAFHMPGGTSEIIKDGFNGYMASKGDLADFANKIKIASKHSFNPAQIKEETKNKFDVKAIVLEYEALFDSF